MHLQLTLEKPAADGEDLPGLALELVLPGVTVPWAHALYLWLATAVSLGVHEVHCQNPTHHPAYCYLTHNPGHDADTAPTCHVYIEQTFDT